LRTAASATELFYLAMAVTECHLIGEHTSLLPNQPEKIKTGDIQYLSEAMNEKLNVNLE